MIHLVPHYTADMGTMPVIYCGDGHKILDGTVSPMRVKEGLDLMIHPNDPRQIAILDKNGVKVVWTEGGQTFIDEAGDIELVEVVE